MTPLPCPFCGRKPVVLKGKRWESSNQNHCAGEWWMRPGIKCTKCRIEKQGESLDEILRWWNERKTIDTKQAV